MKKYPVIMQHSEEDCGAACVASILKFYGRNLTINRIREAIGSGQLGTTLLGLRRGTEALGLYTRTGKASENFLKNLSKMPLPAIIHWQGYHWVVLYGQRGKQYIIGDPAIGIRYLSQQELIEGWQNGVVLLLQPDANRFFAEPDDKVNTFEKLIQGILPHRGVIIEALVISQLIGLLSLASPFLVQILTDDVLVRRDSDLLISVVLAVIVMHIVNSSLELVQNMLIANFAQRLQLKLMLEFGQKILNLPLKYYEARRSGEVSSRVRDIEKINSFIAQAVIGFPTKLFMAIVCLCLMFYYSWKLALFSLIIVFLMSISTIVFLPIVQQKTRKYMVLDAENQGVLVEIFKGALTLKTTTSAAQFWEELQSRFTRLTKLSLTTIQIEIINQKFSGLVANIGSTVLLLFGSQLVISKELTIGQLLAFSSLTGNVTGLFSFIIDVVDEFAQVQTAHSRIQEVIDSTPEASLDTQKPWANIPDNTDIICSQLSFYYAGRIDLLEDFSVTIPGGKVIALIGKSGCGKSTLAKLIAGLHTVQSGNIRYGIYNQQDLSLESLRQQVVLVPQDAHFWSRSIIENFRLGSPNVSFEEIVNACQITLADEFISKLPDTYQTVLGEFGANISGGQRQRLALARAIVHNPPILILDESTAGLDPSSESEILDRLLFYRTGKTTIIISHRPRVIERADWIIFLEKGKLKMEGKVEELRSLPGDHLDFLTP
ncbi:peptidase domain-containing ABC transporter [Calothrix sp. FACHB-1219]|uniref:peptidase domain-containing ABC transporter n=1 Tax=unclassified Calothrix TaxID=2619626 RepID=UPI0016821FEE|nr:MULTISPECIES: peptidase domain-containing ABC transporter [unclassified Calothrix]MBD2204073.1 peptidase domain-containing ABC transporter [Calothrix sp. FACHB-168]MBD2221246.1 peptidase domain-containing ABC transporter [Calothrix sp. FACHB-1219]